MSLAQASYSMGQRDARGEYDLLMVQDRRYNTHARYGSVNTTNLNISKSEIHQDGIEILQVTANQSVPIGGQRVDSRKLSLSKSFIRSLQQINKELKKKTKKQKEQSADRSSISKENLNYGTDINRLHIVKS